MLKNTDKVDYELSKEDALLLAKSLQNLLHIDFRLSDDEFHRACVLYDCFVRH